MKTFPLALCCIASLFLGGCSLKEKYAKNNAAAHTWVESGTSGAAKANFEGVYYSPDWGTVALKQSGKSLEGSIGDYNLKGVVFGKSAKAVLVNDHWVYFTAILLRKGDGNVEGRYSTSVPYSVSKSIPVRLIRIER